MSDAQSLSGPLAGLRVLELADEKGHFCGKLFGDLGADVVKIEPLGGEPSRRIGPFLDDIPHPERSLSFWYSTRSRAVPAICRAAASSTAPTKAPTVTFSRTVMRGKARTT